MFSLSDLNEDYGRFTLLQWIIIIGVILLIVGIFLWVKAEMERPPPELLAGRGVGFFDGRNYGWYADATITEQAKAQNCFNSSWMSFWGNITFLDGSRMDVSQDGRIIDGLICPKSVNNRKWMSSDQKDRVDITFEFVGVIKPRPYIDVGEFFWPLVAGGFAIAFFWALWFRKHWWKPFDAEDAEEVFIEWRIKNGYPGKGEIYSIQGSVPSGISDVFTVGQKVDRAHRMIWAILQVDTKGQIKHIDWDTGGDKVKYMLGREAHEFKMRMEESGRKFGDADMERAREQGKAEADGKKKVWDGIDAKFNKEVWNDDSSKKDKGV